MNINDLEEKIRQSESMSLLPVSASIAPAPAAIPAMQEHGAESRMSKKSGAESLVWYQFCTLCP